MFHFTFWHRLSFPLILEATLRNLMQVGIIRLSLSNPRYKFKTSHPQYNIYPFAISFSFFFWCTIFLFSCFRWVFIFFIKIIIIKNWSVGSEVQRATSGCRWTRGINGRLRGFYYLLLFLIICPWVYIEKK